MASLRSNFPIINYQVISAEISQTFNNSLINQKDSSMMKTPLLNYLGRSFETKGLQIVSHKLNGFNFPFIGAEAHCLSLASVGMQMSCRLIQSASECSFIRATIRLATFGRASLMDGTCLSWGSMLFDSLLFLIAIRFHCQD